MLVCLLLIVLDMVALKMQLFFHQQTLAELMLVDQWRHVRIECAILNECKTILHYARFLFANSWIFKTKQEIKSALETMHSYHLFITKTESNTNSLCELFHLKTDSSSMMQHLQVQGLSSVKNALVLSIFYLFMSVR